TTYCLPRYLLMVFALAGDSTMTRAFAISFLTKSPEGGVSCLRLKATLPHFDEVLSWELPRESQHFQLEKRSDQLGWRNILHLFKQIVQMYGNVHWQGCEYPAGFGAQSGINAPSGVFRMGSI